VFRLHHVRRSFPHHLTLVPLVLLGLVGAFPTAAVAQTLPAEPDVLLDTTYPISGLTINVPGGGDLQGALDRAQPGDTILLDPGTTYVGPFTLPAKSGSEWIVIRTRGDGALPPEGTRINPNYAGNLAKIVTPNNGPAIQTAPGAHHYRLAGVEITTAPGVPQTYGLVHLGDASRAQNSLGLVPYALTLDRVYIHGRSDNNVRRGVALNSASTSIIDSYISEIHEAGADSQAIGGWNGPGPYKIVNNYLEGAGENVMFGGADPSISGLVPSDIEIRGNHIHKPASWRTAPWTVKNLFELKNARRVLIDGNVFEHNWPAAQNGFSILFTVRNQDGTAPWSVVEDVTFTNNIVRHVAAAVNILGRDNLQTSGQTRRVLIKNNLFDDVDAGRWGGNGRLFQMLDGSADVTIEHNTALHSGEVVMAAGAAHSGFVYRDNLTRHNAYGVAGDGTTGDPSLTLSRYFPGVQFSRDVLAGGTASQYPSGNYFPGSLSDVQFVNLSGGDYHLASGSPYKSAASDGRDVGADIDAINRATGGAAGSTSTPPPSSGDSAPTVSIQTPANGSTVSGTVRVSATASDDKGVASVTFQLDGAGSLEDTAAPYDVSWDTTRTSDGSHVITAIARDTAGNTASSTITVNVANGTGGGGGGGGGGSTTGSGEPVSWTSLVNVTASGNNLSKTGGCDGCQDAGAVSGQQITNGSGFVEFTIGETATQRAIGLNAGNGGTTVADIDFGLMLWPGGGVDVREGGVYRTETTSVVGDVFRIALDNGVVTYAKNANVFYQSAVAATYPLAVDTSFLSRNGTASNVRIGYAGGTSGGGSGGSTPSSSGVQGVSWTSLVNVTANGNSLEKTGGCDGCQDAGAVSSQQIGSAGGYVEFTITETATQRAVGLNAGNDGTTVADIDFGLTLWPGGGIDVREGGVYRTESTSVVGDVFRITVSGGVVTYAKNESVFYQSAVAPTYPLVADTSLLSPNATASNVMISVQ